MRSLIILLAAAAVASADEIELRNGDVVRDCKVTDLGTTYRIAKGGLARVVDKSEVLRVEFKDTSEDIYRKRAEALKADDLAGRLALARWCRERNLAGPARDEFAKVVALAPDHEEARLALGHRRHEGRWLTEDEFNAARGLVKHNGRWMTPAERDLDVALDEQRVLDRRLAAEVRRLIDRVGTSDEKKRAEAIEALGAFDDKHKIKPCVTALGLSSRPLRLFAAQELGRMAQALGDEAWPATRALARRSVWDEAEEVRAEAQRSLLLIGHRDAPFALTPFLDEESPTAHARTAAVLGTLRDARAFPHLLRVLGDTVETLRFVEQHESHWASVLGGVIVTRDGRRIRIPAHLRVTSELFDQEGRRRLEDARHALIGALASIAGRNHGEDFAAWRDWYEKHKAGKPGSK